MYGQMACAAVLVDDPAQPYGDLLQGLVPADPLEPAGSLGPDPPHRMEDAVGRLGVLQIAVDLHAERAAGVGMVGVATHLDGLAVLDGHHPRTGVRAVQRTSPQHSQFTQRHALDCSRAQKGRRRGYGFRALPAFHEPSPTRRRAASRTATGDRRRAALPGRRLRRFPRGASHEATGDRHCAGATWRRGCGRGRIRDRPHRLPARKGREERGRRRRRRRRRAVCGCGRRRAPPP